MPMTDAVSFEYIISHTKGDECKMEKWYFFTNLSNCFSFRIMNLVAGLPGIDNSHNDSITWARIG